jgi:hypothetical protein
MPYNVDRSLGGDDEKNTSFMERCVTRVQDSGKDKPSAIAICKAQMKKSKEKKSELDWNDDSPIEIEAEVLNRYTSFREQWIRKSMQMGKSFQEASYLFEAYLSINNYII